MFHVKRFLGSRLILRSIQLSVARGRVGHAYIICGGKGFGKKTLATHFAGAILCNSPVDGLACGACKACKTCESGNNPDLVFVQSEKVALSVGEVRDKLLADLAVSPDGGERRVYVIQNADKMNPQAQNAMLLSLEDGPKHAVFLLLAEGLGGFLPTILSRCVEYKIPPLGEDIVAGYLIEQGVAPDKAKIASKFSQGGIGRALALLGDEDFAKRWEFVLDLVQSIISKDIVEIFAAAKELEQYKDHIEDVLDIMQMFYRDALIEFLDPDALHKIHAISNTRERLRANCNFLMCMEVLLLKLGGKYEEKI